MNFNEKIFLITLSFILVGCSSHLDKAKGQYLAEVWVPINGVPNSIKRYYSYDENKKLEGWDSKPCLMIEE